MSSNRNTQAFLIDPAIFKRLIGSIDNFVSQNQENVKRIDDWMFDVENELQKINDLLDQRFMDAQTKLQNADFELNMCRSLPDYDDEGRPRKPDCSSQEHERMKAKRQVDVSQKNLNQLKELLRYAQKFATEYEGHKANFMKLLDNKLPNSEDTLSKHHQIMEEYMNLTINRNGA